MFALWASVTDYHMPTDEGIIPGILPSKRTSIMHGVVFPLHRIQILQNGVCAVGKGVNFFPSQDFTPGKYWLHFPGASSHHFLYESPPPVSMGIAELGRETSSNYKHWILIPNPSILGKWWQMSILRMTQKAEAGCNPNCYQGCKGLVLWVLGLITDTVSMVYTWAAEDIAVRRQGVCYLEIGRGSWLSLQMHTGCQHWTQCAGKWAAIDISWTEMPDLCRMPIDIFPWHQLWVPSRREEWKWECWFCAFHQGQPQSPCASQVQVLGAKF